MWRLWWQYKGKIPVKKVTVVVALDLDTGNKKNPDNESEQWTIRYIDRLQGYSNGSVPISYVLKQENTKIIAFHDQLGELFLKN